MKFKEWLLFENTVAQLLKNSATVDQQTLLMATQAVNEVLQTKAWTRTIPPEKLNYLTKWLVYQWVALTGGVNFQTKQPLSPNHVKQTARFYLDDNSDYLAAMFTDSFNIIRSKLNNPNYNSVNLKADSGYWHAHIASQKRQPGPKGRVVPLAGMPKGWQWVSLDKGYCDKEGDAMGHCGNAGFKEGDNIYSLRDSKGIPHLTFIVNNGVLGESKGYGNQKPSKFYHQMIMALLLGKDNGHEIIGHIRGGGYLPQNNFDFTDLTKEQQAQITQAKPYLLDWFGFIKNRVGSDIWDNKSHAEAVRKHISQEFNFDFESINFDKGFARLKSWNGLEEMIKWLKDNTNSDLKQIPDFEDGFQDWDMDVGISDALEMFKYSANKKNEALVDKIIEILAKQHGNDEDEDYDLKWAAEQDDELANALQFSADDGYRYGAESDVYKSVVNFFNKESNEYSFRIDKNQNHKWELIINFKDLEALRKEFRDSNEDISYYIDFKYKAPHNGYSGFDDEAYNERLGEMLNDVLSSLSS